MERDLSKQVITAVALLGEETLLGREVKEVLEARDPRIELEGYAASGEGNFSEQEGETVYVKPFEAGALSAKTAVVIAGSADGALKAYNIAKEASERPLVIDCTGLLEDKPEARIVGPFDEGRQQPEDWLLVPAHPASSSLALMLLRLIKYRPIVRVVVTILEPASERGKRGLGELHQQTTSLLSFKPLDKDVFDAQLAFNALPQLGSEAVPPLIHVEQRMERELTTILSRQEVGSTIPLPSIRLVQAPVFHGYSFSLWVEFDANVTAQAIEESLASAQIEIRQASEEAPNSAGAAGQSGLIAGDIRVDRNYPRAAWIWASADNLRLMADAAVDVLRAATDS